MRVLFVMRHSGYVRNFESTLRMLCDRGHRVHVAFQNKGRHTLLDPTDTPGQLAERYSNFSYGDIPARTDGGGLLGRELRRGIDYLRYFRPEYRDAPKLRERASREVAPGIVARAQQGFTGTPLGRMALAASLRLMDRAIPRDAVIDAYIAKIRPDVLAVTPLLELGSPQTDFIRSARALGVRTALCVASWDNLTNKGVIHGPVDLVAVWNEAMKREAIELHGIPRRRVVVSGAAAFDHWFDWRPSTTREAFCARVGLPSDRPYVLYLCSSRFVAPEEVPFVRRWAEQIRQSPSPTLRRVGILVRPHPQNADQWKSADVAGLGDIAVWPPSGAIPVDEASRSAYFDSMYHSTAVVGVNTTAEIESAILGRPVFTVLAPEFRDTQEGTLHFHHLRDFHGGLVNVAHDLAEHLAQLETGVQAPADEGRCRRFVEAFVRPHGLDAPATPRLVAALESLARRPARRRRDPVWAALLRPQLARRSAILAREAEVAAAAQAAQRMLSKVKRKVRDAQERARLAEQALEEVEKRARRTAVLQARELHTMPRLVEGFHRLGEVDRRNFLRATFDAFPPLSYIELHAATKPRKLDYEHADILMRVMTDAEEFRLRACSKEPFTIEWIHRNIGEGDVLYDIGANVGAYSLVAAKKPGGRARVFSFEPGYASVATLCCNVILNDVARLVTPVPVALSNTTGMSAFGLRNLEPGGARHVLGAAAAPGDGPILYEQPVMTFRLDDVVELLRLPLPTHIKLDVDGTELAVLDGASRTLASPLLRSILVEVATSASDDVIRMLASAGLRLESKVVLTTDAGEHAVWYGIFARDRNEGRTTR